MRMRANLRKQQIKIVEYPLKSKTNSTTGKITQTISTISTCKFKIDKEIQNKIWTMMQNRSLSVVASWVVMIIHPMTTHQKQIKQNNDVK